MKFKWICFGVPSKPALWVAVAAAFLNVVPARAQVGPQILMKPWQDGPHWSETLDELIFFDRGYTKHTDLSTKVWSWDFSGRIKLSRQDPAPAFVIGYRINTMGVDSDEGAINGDLWDVAIVGALRLCEIGHGWQLSLLGGAGTSHDNHWTDTDAIYPLAALDLSAALDVYSTLHLGIECDGNRVLWPDIPLPYLAYTREFNEKLTCTLGLPRTLVLYKPIEPLHLSLDYTFPDELTARVSFTLKKNVMIFGEYARGTMGFHIHQRGDERLFYQLQRVTIGVRWITKLFDASLGLGYGLEQEFTRGLDITNTRKVAELSDEPFFSVKIAGTF